MKTKLAALDNQADAQVIADTLNPQLLLEEVEKIEESTMSSEKGFQECVSILVKFTIKETTQLELMRDIIIPLSTFSTEKNETFTLELGSRIEKKETKENLTDFVKQILSGVFIKHANLQAVLSGETAELVRLMFILIDAIIR